MPVRGEAPDVVRIVEGVTGHVSMEMDLVIRFDYGAFVPWVRRVDGALQAIAGPDALELRTPVATHGEGLATVAHFEVGAGERVPFVLTWHPSHLPPSRAVDAVRAVDATASWWSEWSARCSTTGELRELVVRSLITLKALTYAPTGGLVAAATTSLPEEIGGVRNWDYRYCWLRDATFSLYALMLAGYDAEALAWRDWLLRVAAGAPHQLQIMYGPTGERRLPELTLDWLPGYEGSTPVRIGNAASQQFQLDVYGEVMDCFHQTRRLGVDADPNVWALQRAVIEFLEGHWQEPDEGIWEVRGPRRHFTHSKVMAWVAADRAVKAVEQFGLEGPADRWRSLRQDIHDEVCQEGFDADRGTFTQSYGRPELDASLLMIPLVGFLPATDPRMAGTVAAIEDGLCEDGFVHRYAGDSLGEVDGLPGGEGAFLPCTFWLADNLALQGRIEEARVVFDRLAGLANDVGLLAEEYHPGTGRMLGNFPQAFTHVALVNTAHNLTAARGPARDRAEAT
jgi:GH15 family glucan-1,4-alpha-glucosidase